MNNYLLSPFGDIVLLAVVSFIFGYLLEPHISKLVKYPVSLFYKVKDFSLNEFYSTQWKRMGNYLGYNYYWKIKSVWFKLDNSEIICDDDKDLQLKFGDVRVYLKNELIDDFRKELNKAIRETKS